MPANYSGTWDIVDNENFEGYMVALGIDFATRKIAGMLKPQKIVEQDGDSFNIKTLTSFRNYTTSFKIGEEFEEITKGLDNKKCQTTVNWDNDKLVCVQKGEKKNRGWTHWMEGDTLYLRLKAAVHYTVGSLCQHIAADCEKQITKQTIAAIAETAFRQCDIFAKDLEAFARHAKRHTVTVDDVKLTARRTTALVG
ncbi:hypothetical protein PO909_005383 [Leuciscus waleckii]